MQNVYLKDVNIYGSILGVSVKKLKYECNEIELENIIVGAIKLLIKAK